MKTLHVIFAAVLISFSGISSANANHNSINGIIIGAGSGALFGQAVGGDTESTLVGSAVGGVVGYMIGNELDRDSHRFAHRKDYRSYDRYNDRRYINSGRPFGKKYHYRDRGRDRVCKKEIQIKERHGRTKKIVTKTCWYEDRYKGYRNHRRDYSDRPYHYRYKF